ncbi:MAG: MMPL family transporter, partial [Bacilli bacterium]|nr:MMPL family transporter [Bacilli bacterium]
KLTEILPDEFKEMLENDTYQLLLISSKYETASNELNAQIEVINDIVKKYDENGIVAGEGPLMRDLVTIADHDFKAVNYTSIVIIFLIMVLVLKQISLPVVLVIAIEFAIFINMAVAYYTGVSLPFIASIVVGTIQLGATIDYAILMSTKYLEEREEIKDKKEAMKKTLSLTIPSIITSALCFFAATFGVAVYTKIDMIGAICELLARGSIISMLVVVLILPSLLMISDKIIIKRKKKEGHSL